MPLISLFVVVGLVGLQGEVVGEREADRARISRHLHVVEAELRARDVGDLPEALQEQRRRNLDRLHRYAAAGEFPRNEDFPGERVPYFIDADGVACAVGFLVIDSGFAEVAQQIHDAENNARLLAMTHPALPAWIAASGLTAEECARIQPDYCECGEEYVPVCGVDGNTYINKCVASTCGGIEVAYDGPCKAEDTTTGWPDPGTEADPGSTGGSSTSGSSSGGTTGDADSSGGGGSTGDVGSSSGGAGDTTGDGASTGVVTGGAAESSSGLPGDTGLETGADDAGTSDDKPDGCRGCRLTGDGGAPLLGLLVLAALRRRRS